MFLLFLCSLFVVPNYGCVTQDFTLGKNTWATTDSERDYSWALKLIPGIEDQGANKFKQGQCGTQSKLVLSDSCFKIHHPNTWQHEQYKTRVSEIETLFEKKISSLKSSNPTNSHHYDSFLDHNIGFYVHDIDTLLSDFIDYNINFWILSWTWSSSIIDSITSSDTSDTSDTSNKNSKQFYSLLTHSPGSQILYEFMTDSTPSNLDNINVLESEMRATFAGFDSNYPWETDSDFNEYTIIPVRISRAVSDIDVNIAFYKDILESNVIGTIDTTAILGGDNIHTRVGFVLNQGASVEISFVERDNKYTQEVIMDKKDIDGFIAADIITSNINDNDDNDEEVEDSESSSNNNIIAMMVDDEEKEDSYYVNKYLNYGIEEWEIDMNFEHENIVKNEYCGFSRWFDNHYGYQVWEYDGLMDRILTALRKKGYTYRIFKQTYQHTSSDGKELLEKYGKDTVYSLWIVEPNGQTLHIGGDLVYKDDEFQQPIPTWDPQWCYQSCQSGDDDAVSDISDDDNSIMDDMDSEVHSDLNEIEEHKIGLVDAKNETKEEFVVNWLVIGGSALGVISIAIVVVYYCFCRNNIVKETLNGINIGSGIDIMSEPTEYDALI